MKTRQQFIEEFIQRDPFAKKLGVRVEIVAPGHSRAYLTVSEDMTNFNGSTHGGIIFSLADIAFAAASNSYGQRAVALNVAITFVKASAPGDQLVAEVKEAHSGGRIAYYDVTVHNQSTGQLIARSQDLVYRLKDWFVPKDEGERPPL